jgi:diguanylate cyclase (GGDEF)-like protein/putative nucleotidyltransferase with HDIG domain
MRLRSLPAAAQWYVRSCIGLGTVVLLTSVLTSPVPWSLALALAMLAAAALASQKLVLVGAPGDAGSRTHLMSTLSLGFPMVLGALLWFGPAGGTIVGIASAIGAGLYPRRHPFYRLWFTTVNLGLAALACGWLMRLLDAAPDRPLPLFPLALLAGPLAYYLINTGMVAVAVALSQGAHPWTTWQQGYLWTAPSYLVGTAIVALAHTLYLRFGVADALLALLCLYLVHRSYRAYLERLHELQVNEGRLQEVCLAAVESLALAIDAKDGVTHGHIRRVQQIALALAEHVRVTPDELQAIRVGSLTHDVGKLAVPDTILAKSGRLSPEEFERVKTHVQVGVRILEPVQFPWPVVEVVRTHHERWDGLGYPHGLAGEAIPLGGRIVAIADVFDALTAPRPYRSALGFDEAHSIIRAGSGTQFDPRLVEAFSEIFPTLVEALHATDSRRRLADGDSAGGTGAALLDGDLRALHGAWESIRGASRETISVALTDPLTGLANARHLAAALPRELERADREGCALSLLMIDLDDFKAINDGYGHLTGNVALQAVADLLRETLREGSIPCRYAGDEFVVLLPETRRDQARRAAERFAVAVETVQLPGSSLPLRLSVGVATFPEDGRTPESLLDIADQRMYAEKARRKAAPSPTR